MIIGKSIYDSTIDINLISKQVTIDYETTVNDKIPFLISFFTPIFELFFEAYFHLIHRPIIIKLYEHLNFNINPYLNFLNSAHKAFLGEKVAIFNSPIFSPSVQVISTHNLQFNYTLSGEMSSLCSRIALTEELHTLHLFGKTYTRSSGWIFTIYFSEIPQTGTASIAYI
jgi:hypothetical protein